MIVEVQCYAGRKADERPVRFRIGDRDYMVEEIVEQRYGRMTASTKCVPTTTTCTCCVTRRVGTPGRLSRSRNLGESWAAIWTSRTKSQLAPGATPPMRCRARMYLRGSVSPVLPVSPAGVKAQMDAPQSRSACVEHWRSHLGEHPKPAIHDHLKTGQR